MVFPGGGCAVPTKKGRSLAESPLGSSVGVSREAYGQFKPGPTLAASVLALPVSIALWAPRFQLSSRADSFGSQHGHRARRRPATSSVLARRRRAPVRPRDWPATSCAGVAHSSNESGWLSCAPPDRIVKTHHHAWWRDGCPARQRNGGLPTPRAPNGLKAVQFPDLSPQRTQRTQRRTGRGRVSDPETLPLRPLCPSCPLWFTLAGPRISAARRISRENQPVRCSSGREVNLTSSARGG